MLDFLCTLTWKMSKKWHNFAKWTDKERSSNSKTKVEIKVKFARLILLVWACLLFCSTISFEPRFFTPLHSLLFREDDNISISGLIVSGAAAASNLVTSMVKIGVTKKKLKQIEVMLHQDSYNFNSLNEAVVELGKYLELLKDRVISSELALSFYSDLI